jgi:hypothetical protein
MKVGKEVRTGGKNRLEKRTGMRMISASERGLSDQIRRRLAAALAQVLVYNALGGVFAASAAGSNRQFVLYVKE